MHRLFLSILIVLFGNSISANAQSLDHSMWSKLLKANVSVGGNVDYKGFKADANQLQSYLSYLEANAPKTSWSENEQLAYWINLYNAATIHLVAENYPVASIREINDGSPWDKQFIHVGNELLSLNEVEHEILRKKFKEPRIHFAINCASESCPRLLNDAYVGHILDQQLNAAARAFINDSSKNKITAKKAELSLLFSWFQEDFTTTGTVISFVNRFSEIKVGSAAQVDYLPYSWQLNE